MLYLTLLLFPKLLNAQMMTSTVSTVILYLFRGHKANYKVSLKISSIWFYHQILIFGLKKVCQVHNFKGKNWIFAVPKTQCHILVKNSKLAQKDNKLIVSLAKMAESDNWFSLHKVKCIGEKDTDWYLSINLNYIIYK
jgi:hypothetical protein